MKAAMEEAKMKGVQKKLNRTNVLIGERGGGY